jgi:hypothetical protein
MEESLGTTQIIISRRAKKFYMLKNKVNLLSNHNAFKSTITMIKENLGLLHV